MPFDGTKPLLDESRRTRAVLMLDYLVEFFAEGRNWYQGAYCGPQGTRCLVQAMSDIRRRERLKGDGASAYIRRAIRETTEFTGLMEFNDTCTDYDEIGRVLCRARQLAEADAAAEGLGS